VSPLRPLPVLRVRVGRADVDTAPRQVGRRRADVHVLRALRVLPLPQGRRRRRTRLLRPAVCLRRPAALCRPLGPHGRLAALPALPLPLPAPPMLSRRRLPWPRRRRRLVAVVPLQRATSSWTEGTARVGEFEHVVHHHRHLRL